MISFETILLGVVLISALTGLVTEAIKKILDEQKRPYRANALAGVVSLILSVAIGIGYVILNTLGFTGPIVVYLVVLAFLSWLCAMVGYDKVIQTISQFKAYKSGEK